VHSSVAFDLTVTSLWCPLLVGNRVTLLGPEPGVEGLERVLREQRDFGLVKITPAHLEVLGERLRDAVLAGQARALVIGGEQLTMAQLRPWMERAPETRLINEYGPTETVVGCCIHEVGRSEVNGGVVAIGTPTANT